EQFGSQPGNQGLQRVAGVAGLIFGPQLAGQRARGDDTPGVQREQSEQDPQLAAADVDWAPRLVSHLKRTQKPDTQCVRHLPSLIARVPAYSPASFNASDHPTLPSGAGSNINVGRKEARR